MLAAAATEEDAYREKIEQLQTFMSDKKLPHELQVHTRHSHCFRADHSHCFRRLCFHSCAGRGLSVKRSHKLLDNSNR